MRFLGWVDEDAGLWRVLKCNGNGKNNSKSNGKNNSKSNGKNNSKS